MGGVVLPVFHTLPWCAHDGFSFTCSVQAIAGIVLGQVTAASFKIFSRFSPVVTCPTIHRHSLRTELTDL